MGHLEGVVGELGKAPSRGSPETSVAEVGEGRAREGAQLPWGVGLGRPAGPLSRHSWHWQGSSSRRTRGSAVSRSLTNFTPQQFETILLKTILLQSPQLLPSSHGTFCSMGLVKAAFHAEPSNASSGLCCVESSHRHIQSWLFKCPAPQRFANGIWRSC